MDLNIQTRLAKRQLKKSGLASLLEKLDKDPQSLRDESDLRDSIAKFVDLVDKAYDNYKNDQVLFQHSRELSSKELETRNRELAAFVNTFPDVIIKLDREATVLDFRSGPNTSEHLKRDNAVGSLFFYLYPITNRKDLEPLISEVIDEDKVKSLECEFNLNDQTTHLEIRLTPFGKDSVMGVIRDISKVRQVQEANANLRDQLDLAMRMQAVGRLAGGIAHDFNNILFSILGFAQVNLKLLPKDNLVHANTKEIVSAANRGKELIDQISIFSRRSERKIEPFCMGKLAGEISGMIANRLHNNLEFKVDIDEELPIVLGDASQISRGLMNLCVNALQAIGSESGSINLRVTDIVTEEAISGVKGPIPPAPYVVATVTDTGGGMNETVKAKAFEPFFTSKKVGEGTGLGLSVVVEVVQEHGGGMTLESEVGKGTKIALYIPSSDVPGQIEALEQKANLVSGNGRILVVDDERMLGKVISQMLSYLGYEVTSFVSPVEALASFRNDPNDFDLLITDQTMPGLSGTEFAEEAKNLRDDVPIILCSGSSEDFEIEDIEGTMADSFLKKPISFENLSKEVAKNIKNLSRSEDHES